MADAWARLTGEVGIALVTGGPGHANAVSALYTALMAESPVSSVSVLPGELCGYSGQKLMGAWSDTPQNAVEYEDRIVHIWTNSGPDYLVAVHVQAPTGTPGFDSAAALLTEDFEIVLP